MLKKLLSRFNVAPNFIIFSTFLSIILLSNTASLRAIETVTTTTCQSGINLLVNNMVQTTTAVSNLATIGVTTQGINTTQIQKVIIFADNQPIGRALPSQNTNYSWEMKWTPGLKPILTTVKLTAQVYYVNTTNSSAIACSTSPVYVTNQSTRAAVLQINNSPLSWTGPMGTSFAIKIQPNVIEPAFDPTLYAIYDWKTTIGNVNFSQNTAQFSTGTNMGSGVITVKVLYGGATKTIAIPITVSSTTAPLPTTAATQTAPAPTSKTSLATQTTTPTIIPSGTVQNPTAQDCVINAIGKDRFNQINTGASRPTPEELSKFNACFASSNFILPSNFAPVVPASVKNLKPAETVKINTLKNENKVVDNVTKQVLKISGKAKPNSVVYIYIFSDPLVLTTTTNSNGDWEYSLEDPIESGKHELYSVVNRGDGVYERSDPMSFVMGTAQAASVNPDGLSLKLVGTASPIQSQRSLGYYIAGSTLILTLSIAVFIVSLLKKSKNNKMSAQFSTDETSSFEKQSDLSTDPSNQNNSIPKDTNEET